jgi:transcriptional regulator with XRE-family HTH domain
MPGNPGPMARRRQLGEALRRHRFDAGMTVVEVAKHLLCHPSKISRLENSQRNASLRDVRDLASIYGLTDETRALLMRLAQESRESAWWHNHDLPPALERIVGLESSAARISEYQIAAVPGLLQTRDYADAMLRMRGPDGRWVTNEALDVRMARQEYLAESTRLRFIVDEAVVRRVVGSTEIMRNQVDHLIRVASTSRVEIQAIPFMRGAQRGMVGSFTVLEFDGPAFDAPELSVPDTVYIEGIGLSEIASLEKPDDVEGYVNAFNALRAMALTPEDTIPFLKTCA